MVELDTGAQPNIGGFNIKPKEEKGGADLTELFDKMQIAVVGRENQNEDDSGISDEEDSEEVGDLDEELSYQQEDPNQIS